MPVGYLQVNTGAVANDGTGSPIRTSFSYVNSNFSGLYESRSVNAISPTGILTPLWTGEDVLTTMSGNAWWKSVSLSITGWSSISNSSFEGEDWGTIP